MKARSLFFLAAAMICLQTAPTRADNPPPPVPAYAGEFSISGLKPHNPTAPVRGTQSLFIKDGVLTEVVSKADAPVINGNPKLEFKSSEQTWVTAKLQDGQDQLSFVYKYAAVPHKWHFCFVGNSKDGGLNFEGSYYKISGSTLADIAKILAPGLVEAPKEWKAVGTGTLKKK